MNQLFISLLISFLSPSLEATEAKSSLVTSTSVWLFLLLAFHFCALWCNPVVCQTEARRCLMIPLFFFQTLIHWLFIFIFYFLMKPTHSVLQHIWWQCRSWGISLFLSLSYTHTFSAPAYFLHHNTSIHPGHCWVVVLSARAWRTQPLTYASPLWPSAVSVLFAVLRIYFGGQGHSSGLFLRVGVDKVLF